MATTDIEMICLCESQFNVAGWYTVDLGGPSTSVINYTLKDFMDSEFFVSDLLHFPVTLKKAYIMKGVEELFDTFGQCIF